MKALRFGFTPDGGFAVVDDTTRRACYSYPSSPNCDHAKRCKGWKLAELAANLMRAECRFTIPTHIAEPHYTHISSKLGVAK